jgi:type VI protein secretion system component VasF
MESVRARIRGLLDEARSRAGAQPGMAEQFGKVELALIYFADFMVKESRLPFAREWRELAHERNKLAGDEEFFDILEETLADRSKEADARLCVLYTCLGLGFTGFYTGQPEYLRKKSMEISTRIRQYMDSDASAKICPEAYEHVDTSNLIEPPGRSLVGFGIALVGLIIVLFIANAFLYVDGSKSLLTSLSKIEGAGLEAAPAETEGAP